MMSPVTIPTVHAFGDQTNKITQESLQEKIITFIFFFFQYIFSYKRLLMNQDQPNKHIDLQILTQQLICPITYKMMVDPVTVETGHTFERKAIVQWLKRGNKKNPMTGKVMKSTELHPNKIIKNIIQKFPKILSTIRKQTVSLQQRLKNFQDLWEQADISDSTIRRQKVKLGNQNQALKIENCELKQGENELKNKLQEVEKEKEQLTGQLNFTKIKFNKQVSQLKKINDKLTRQNKILQSQIIKKDGQLKIQKQTLLKMKEDLNTKQRELSRNKSKQNLAQINPTTLSRQKKNINPSSISSREILIPGVPKTLSREKINNSQHLYRPKTENDSGYRQRKFQSPSQKLKIQISNNNISYEPSKWNKSPSNKSLQKRPSIYELLKQAKNQQQHNEPKK